MGSLTGIESVTRFSKYDFTVFLDELASFDRQSDKELLLKRWTTVVKGEQGEQSCVYFLL